MKQEKKRLLDSEPDLQPEGEEPEEDLEEDDTDGVSDGQANSIIQTGSVTTRGRHVIHCLTIIGQVEGHYILPSQNKTTKYEHVMPQLVAIEQDPDIKGLIILINTVGGDVEAGLAIAELIAGMSKPTVSIVLGGGHSIGVPLAVSADRSFIVPSATMTIHPVRMTGLVLGVPQTLSYFEKMQDRIVGFVVKNSRITEKRFRKLMMTTGVLVMDMGTVLNGGDAVEEGLIDELGGLSDAVECLYGLIDKREGTQNPEAKKRSSKGAKRPDKLPEKAAATPKAPRKKVKLEK